MRKMSTKNIRTTVSVSDETYKKLNRFIVEEHGKVFGHVSETIENAIKFYLEAKKRGGL